ncbi:nitrogen fixation protein NifH [Methanocella sp. CWC-04]|uniref:Nitrogen fixation protein NifH n=1 Tax=Methanooceanicella nereidis TaxID=2052831 RepID=A0AAP2RCP9_9EURY|nr:nitrogen fixation protein NifH [Methanocella sp. CWC-04]MCD1293650.1 nitrogen fixation protein NifH [Methanocella sp. CWC-04]
MSHWSAVLNESPVEWLLEADDPSVRYFTLRDILDRPEKDAEVRDAKARIMDTGVIPKILSKQEKGGYWGVPGDFYMRSKYKGTVWQFIVLAGLGADGKDERIKNACEFILSRSQDPESGGFSYISGKSGAGDRDRILPCLTGNMVWGLIRFGYLSDSRVKRGIGWITKYQRFDDGENRPPEGWPYDRFEICWGKHTCHMGVIKSLKALSEIPEDKRTKAANKTIENAAEYLLMHHIFKKSHDIKEISKPDWLRFGFPLMWNTDVLEISGILAGLGYKDERMQEAIDLIVSKQDEHGRWSLENTFNGRFLVNIERKNKPGKWVTLNAIRVLKAFYGLSFN